MKARKINRRSEKLTLRELQVGEIVQEGDYFTTIGQGTIKVDKKLNILQLAPHGDAQRYNIFIGKIINEYQSYLNAYRKV